MKAILDLITQAFHRRQFLHGVAVIVGGTVFAQSLGIAASPILTRLYLPEHFGVFAVFASILGMLSVTSSYRYEMAIPLPAEDRDAATLFILSLALVGINFLLLCVIISIFSGLFIEIFNIKQIGPYLWLLPFGFLSIGTYQILSYWSIRKKNYAIIGKTKIYRSLFQISSQLVLGYLKSSPIGLMVGHIIGEAGGLGALARVSWLKDKENLKTVTLSEIKQLAWRYRKFPYIMTLASLFNSAGLQVPILLFASLYGSDVAGWFFLTQKVMAMPISLIGKSVSQVFTGEASRLAHTDPAKLKKLFRNLNFKLFIYGAIPCLILSIYGDNIFCIVFGDTWMQSGRYVQVLAYVYLLKLSSESLINHALLERQELSLFWGLGRLILVSLAIILPCLMGYNAFVAVVIYSLAMGISYFANYILWNYAISFKIKRHSNEKVV